MVFIGPRHLRKFWGKRSKATTNVALMSHQGNSSIRVRKKATVLKSTDGCMFNVHPYTVEGNT